jgi:hypothetical protein
MKYIVTPDLLTVLNENGDEFTMPIHSAEYAILLVVGITLTGPRFDYGCYTIELCSSYQDIPPDVKRFEKVVREMFLSKLMFISCPSWVHRWLNVATISFTETYAKCGN